MGQNVHAEIIYINFNVHFCTINFIDITTLKYYCPYIDEFHLTAKLTFYHQMVLLTSTFVAIAEALSSVDTTYLILDLWPH